MKIDETSPIEHNGQNALNINTSEKTQLNARAAKETSYFPPLSTPSCAQAPASNYYHKPIYPYPTFYEVIPQNENKITSPTRVIVKEIDETKLCIVTEDEACNQQTWKIPFFSHAIQTINISDVMIVRPSPLGSHMEIFANWPPVSHIEELIKKTDIIRSRL